MYIQNNTLWFVATAVTVLVTVIRPPCTVILSIISSISQAVIVLRFHWLDLLQERYNISVMSLRSSPTSVKRLLITQQGSQYPSVRADLSLINMEVFVNVANMYVLHMDKPLTNGWGAADNGNHSAIRLLAAVAYYSAFISSQHISLWMNGNQSSYINFISASTNEVLLIWICDSIS